MRHTHTFQRRSPIGAIPTAADSDVPERAAVGYSFRSWLDPDELARIHEAQPNLVDRLTQSWDEDQALADEAHGFIGEVLANMLATLVVIGCVWLIVSTAL